MADITQTLSKLEQGDPSAAEQLLPLVYDELRRLAHAKLAGERHGQTLQTTALVHEAYIRLVGKDADLRWDSRGHFFAAAAEAMRRILIDNARRKRRPKQGGGRERIELHETSCFADAPSEEMLAVHEALDALAEEAPEKADVVKLRYFAGFTIDEVADLLGISPATAKRHWAYARAWLRCEVGKADSAIQPRPDDLTTVKGFRTE